MPPEEKHEIRGWASIKDYSSKDISLQNALVDSLVKTISNVCSPSTVYYYDGKRIYDYVYDPFNEIDVRMAQKDLLEHIIKNFILYSCSDNQVIMFFGKQKSDKKVFDLAMTFMDLIVLLSEAYARQDVDKKDCTLIKSFGLTSLYSQNDSYYIEITKEFTEWISQNPDDYFITTEERNLLL